MTIETISFAPWPHHQPDELDAVHRVLVSGKTNYWTGQEARHFEREYAQHLGRKHAIALNNGTQAIELALVALGVGPGDEVITTPRTFIASASAAVMRGATPVLVDVDREGRSIRQQSRWGEGGTNANFFVIEDRIVHMRTYERGVEAETWSCGTGAVATALAAWYALETPSDAPTEIELNTPGGSLRVKRDESGMIWLTGPAVRVFEGRVKYAY